MKRTFLDKIRIYRLLPPWYRAYMLRLNLSWKLPRFREWEARRLKRRFQRASRLTGEVSLDAFIENCYVTSVPHPTVGIGHTLSEYNSAVVFAETTGATYVHCPLPEPWDSLLHFRARRLTIDGVRQQNMREIRLPKFNGRLDANEIAEIRQQMRAHARQGKVLFILGDGQSVYDHSPCAFAQQRQYWQGIQQELGACAPIGQWHRSVDVGPIQPPAFFSPSAHNTETLDPQERHTFQLRDRRANGRVNVAVHLRRRNSADGWVSSMGSDERADGFRRFLPLEYFFSLCQQIESCLGADAVQFNLFGQGSREDFRVFEQLQHVQFCLDSDAYESFYNLTLADVLVTSPSAFSYMAGVLCPGLKVANYPWWQEIPVAPDWLRVDAAENFDVAQFMQKLRSLQASVEPRLT